jgi:hypothetical protein
MLTWRDTSDRVIDYFQGIVAMLSSDTEPAANALDAEMRDSGSAILRGYIEALTNHGGRTGVLVARRMTPT